MHELQCGLFLAEILNIQVLNLVRQTGYAHYGDKKKINAWYKGHITSIYQKLNHHFE